MKKNVEQTTIFLKDFSRYPSGRYKKDGDFSGEQYRDEVLEPAVKEFAVVTVDMSSVFAVARSFLDEAFGPFAKDLGEKKFWEKFKIVVTDDPDLVDELRDIVSSRTK